MKKIFLILMISSVAGLSCKKQLDVKNPNEPTPEASTNEQGIISLAQGGVYVNGFKSLKYGDGVFGLFWSGAMGFHEMLGDVIGVEAANAFCNQIGCPDKVTLDNGTALPNPNNPSKWYTFARGVNQNDQQGSNFSYYEWAYMYNMISACNSILDLIPNVTFTGNSATKAATLKAWAHFWKGFAYSHIGSIYYAGIINNTAGATNGNYVAKEAIIAESNAQFDLAIADLGAATSASDYDAIIGKLIPSFCQVGKGKAPTTAMWIRNINTMKARNILVNKPVSAMAAADWNNILTLTNSGVQASDFIFTGRTTTTGDFLPASAGYVAVKVQSSNAGGGTYKLSERWVQDFKAGDKRKDNNVKQSATPWIGNSDRGNAFNTRFTLINGGNGVGGAYIYANTATGAFELPLAGTYEENALMKAEAQIYLGPGSIEAGLQLIDAVRNSMGAGLPAVAGTGLTEAQAKEELRRERRIALAFRGLSFYDARRWKISEPAAAGGGRTGCNVITTAGALNTNATIEYGYLDYWDVPDNELAYNPAVSGTVKNPKQ
jgi:starch-binding outer membrane protein, SusD/RagB family